MYTNLVYDINGKKGPNTVGKDIGFISAMYATDPVVFSPNPYHKKLEEPSTQIEASIKYKEIDKNLRLPNINELISLFFNMKIFEVNTDNQYWSNTSYSTDYAWVQSTISSVIIKRAKSQSKYVLCVKN